MVGAVAVEDHVLGALALVAPVLARHLERRLDRLAAAEAEEDVIEVAGQMPGDLGGQLDRGRVGDAEHVVAGDVVGLGADGVVDLGAAVADVDRPEAGERVEVLVAVHVAHHAALGALHDDRRQPLHLRERWPEVVGEVVLECFDLLSRGLVQLRVGVVIARRCHRSPCRGGVRRV